MINGRVTSILVIIRNILYTILWKIARIINNQIVRNEYTLDIILK